MNTFFSRGDFIATRVAMVTAAALYPLLVLAPKLISWATGAPLVYVGRSAAAGPPLDEPTPGVEGRYSDEVVWRIADASAGQWIASLLPILLTTALLVAGCVLLWRLVVATQQEEPFTVTAVRRVRAVGFLVLGYGVIRPFLEPLTTLAIFWSESEPSIAFALDFSLVFPLAVGFLILVVAECFRIGTQIRHDVDGLV